MLRVLLAAVAVLLLLLAPLPEQDPAVRALFDLAHPLLFALLAAAFRTRLRTDLGAFAAAAAFGGLVELAQAATGRDLSAADAAANAAGAAAVLLFRRGGAARVATGVLVLAGACLRPAAVLADTARQDLPRLASFEDALEMTRWSFPGAAGVRAEEHATHGTRSLRLELRPGTYPGARLERFPRDWSSWSVLAFSAYVPGAAPLPLTVKVHDLAHDGDVEDRYQRTHVLAPGRNDVRIPLAGLPLDLRRVAVFQVFVHRLAEPRTVFLDALHLE